MLDDLVGVIETLQERIRTHGGTLRANEIRTRTSLIDPLLKSLGWDVADPALVMLEYAVGNGRADYALLNERGSAVAFIEAKHLGEPLERPQHEDQVFTYALRQQVKYAALTDGDRWILDDVSVFSGDRRLLDISIADMPAYESALKLLLLLHPNLVSGQLVVANRPILPDDPPPPPPPSNGWELLSAYDPPSGGSPPAAIRFPDGTENEVRFWHELVVCAVAWLWGQGSLTQSIVPIPTSPRSATYIVNTEPVHQSGNRFRSRREVSGTLLVVEGHGSGRDMRERTKLLLNHCGVSPDEVWLKVGE